MSASPVLEKPSRVVVVTGVTRGLGRAMCDRLVEMGHTVVGCGRDGRSIAGLQKRFPAPHDFTALDVSHDSEVRAWARATIKSLGRVDLLLNNAAVINRNAPLWEVPADEFQEVIKVNIQGVANCIRHFVPSMIARGSGVIVNFSSGWGRSTSPDVAPYCATKYAIEGMTGAMAAELPKGLAVVALNPGIINTDMLQSCFSESANHYPLADEWSRRAVPFILSLGAEHNGRSLNVG